MRRNIIQALPFFLIPALFLFNACTGADQDTGKTSETAQAQPRQEAPKMAMTTDIPEGIATPDYLETRIGTL